MSNDQYIVNFDEKLEQQISLIKNSIRNFDEWHLAEALNLATRLRVLLHKWNWVSLLEQLWRNEDMLFYDTSTKQISYSDAINIGHNWLVEIINTKLDGVKYTPILDKNPSSKYIKFDDRWDWIIFTDTRWSKFSRKKIILFLANKDWWAHVSSTIEEKNHSFIKENSLWFYIKKNWKEEWLDWYNLWYYAARQIAHEFLRSVDENYEYFLEAPEWESLGTNMGIVSIEVEPILDKKIWRNKRCPCWSWKRYRKCCLV